MDDNPRNLRILQMILGREYALVTATSGGEALAALSEVRPDLVLLDIMMPGIDGYETCRRLRKMPGVQHVKVIMVSARATTADRLEGYAAGADDYVTKPFDEDELLAKVRVHLRLKSVEEVDALKTAFIDLLGHETRTPLTGIIGSAELLQADGPMDDDTRRWLADVIARSGRRLHGLFEKVTTLAALRCGTVVFEQAEVPVRDLLRQAVQRVEEQAGEREVAIEVQLEGEPTIVGDERHLLFVLSAVLENAVRASAPGQHVLVAASMCDERVRLVIRDRGEGMTPELLTRMFEEFTIADVQHHSEGHGLSLAVARRVVGAHGGTLTAESAPGSGAAFTIELPAAGAAGRQTQAGGVA